MGDGRGATRFEVDLGTIDPSGSPAGGPGNDRSTDRRWVLVVLLLVGAGAWWGATWSSEQDDAESSPDPTPSTTTRLPDAQPDAVTEDDPGAGVPPTLPGAVMVRPPVALDTTVALAAFRGPLPGDHVVLVLTPDGEMRRALAPLQPGDWPYPLLFVGDAVAFAGQESAFRMTAETLEVSPIPVGPTHYLVPGVRAGEVWVVHDADAPVVVSSIPADGDPVTHQIEGIWWVEAGVADGLLVRPDDEDRYGAVAYWTPAGGLVALSSLDPTDEMLAASGDLAAVTSPGSPDAVQVVDVRRDTEVTEIVLDNVSGTVSDTQVRNACFSPDQSHLTVSTAEITLTYDMDHPTAPVHAMRGVSAHHAVAYTAPDELVAIVGDEILSGINVATGRVWAIAELTHAKWWIASSLSSC